VYELLSAEFTAAGMTVPSQSFFLHVWRSHELCRMIKVRKYLRFAKCTMCVRFRERRNETRDPKTIADLNAEVRAHHLDVKAERAGYYDRRLQACLHPTRYMSVIIDGADQQRYGLPHFCETDHSTMNSHRIHLHLMGVLNHGRGPQAITYLPNVKQGTNVTVDCLHLALLQTLIREGCLPDTLCMQLDNTSKQCKSQFVMGFLGLLINCGVFQQVIVSFLPVGHTHEDVDQFFSRTSVWRIVGSLNKLGELLGR
jgi:hypothetical protein